MGGWGREGRDRERERERRGEGRVEVLLGSAISISLPPTGSARLGFTGVGLLKNHHL